MPDYELHMIWSTPLVKVKNPDHARIKPGLVRYCQERQRRAQTAVESGVTPQIKHGLYESSFDLFKSNESPEVQAVAQFCMRSVADVAGQLRAKRHPNEPGCEVGVSIPESWVHITRDRGYHDNHVHPNCSWCGIYCVEPGDSSPNPTNGTNRFEPPIDPGYVDFGTEAYDFDSIHICPEDGLLVLFPSYLRHGASLYSGSRERIVIAFNARLNRIQPGAGRA